MIRYFVSVSVTENDEKRGFVKTTWANIRKRVKSVEPNFAKLVDELNPDKSFPIFLAYYPYGAMTGDTKSPLIPKTDTESYRLSDPNAPKDVIKHLGYGKNSLPFGMLLEKELEYFIDMKNEAISVPWITYHPGSFFPFSRILTRTGNRIYSPNGILSTTSGARSVFMLPNIGCLTNHINLQRDFNVQSQPAKTLYEHWHLFKQIINSNIIKNDWRSCIMFFSEKWVHQLHSDKAWLSLKTYLYELAWQHSDHQRNNFYYDIAFSIMKKDRNLKPNPYLADTARHLFSTALGSAPGYAPACNNDSLPLDLIQQAFIESYGLKKYYPTILKPTRFNFEEGTLPVYYSLQNPATHVFSPKSRAASSTLFEMRELAHVMRVFIEELTKENSLCKDTILSHIAKNIQFNYFHNKLDRHKIVKASSVLDKLDERFSFNNIDNKLSKAVFASDAPFLRGCISIGKA